MRAAAVISLLTAGAVAAQERDVLYVNPAPLVTASRLSAMGGAAVGIAENSESLPFNYAAAAHRHPRRKGGFDWDVTASVLFAPFPVMRDIDNEGQPPRVIAPVESQFGGLIQFSRFGIGAYLRLARRDVCTIDASSACPAPSTLSATAAQGSIVFGFNVARDQLVFAGGLFLASASFGLNGKSYDYRDFNLGGAMLWRPHYLPFRIGVHGVTETSGKPQFDVAAAVPELGGRKFFRMVTSPAHLSLGASARFGQGAWRYNRLSQSALKQLPDDYNFAEVPHDLDPDDPRPPGRFLVTLQLDVVFPVKNATTLTPFLVPGATAVAVGESLYLVPRLGFEAEVVDHRLRLRLGGYLEPPFLAGSTPRPHGTIGGEVFLFNLLADWSISVAMDVAPRYLSMSFGIGWWT